MSLFRGGDVEAREMPVDIMNLSKPAEDRPEKVSTCA